MQLGVMEPHQPALRQRESRIPGSDVITDLITDLVDDLDEDTPGLRIRCPNCAWTPGPLDRWFCGSNGPPERYAGCATSWNTFQTRGRCPGCDHQWQWTSCPACDCWARHEDWYEDDQRRIGQP